MLEKINAITVKKKLVKNVAKSFVELTSLGKKLSDFPVDPIFARYDLEKCQCRPTFGGGGTSISLSESEIKVENKPKKIKVLKHLVHNFRLIKNIPQNFTF